MLVDYDSEDEQDDPDEDAPAALPIPALALPSLAEAVANHGDSDDEDDEDEDEDDDNGKKSGDRQDEEEESNGILPSVDDALNASGIPDFLREEVVMPSYGSVLDASKEELAAAEASDVAAASRVAELSRAKAAAVKSRLDKPEKKTETTRQKNSRKEKLGQATFTLKWDRDCGHEKASAGLDTSATLSSRTQAKTNLAQRAEGKSSMKDRTKEKRKRDQSASFLGGRWKSEEEMHLRDHFDS
mmetsp:Transcript_887/g.1478  ORF Transcript_887/g.1478 Transcript_887/m.1478 type:complete len:243 (-) Transcript_887:236-964(-)|eukprot:CAMPEP_0119314698 /NCGR_PEP_ID=MMETSP1333-20130426/33714_1 /TAXON_ID=418940 /ORGANISM="Scyphosphaera apsteinii, Strain RCC1455" /LENGTH=242 /DNA_ID=CAMNT_0007319869 /DNA_START=20 /DNA_END=748 /DNA_ORIENTATION=+